MLTLYLTDNTPAEEIERAANSDAVYACKLYPAGATTNSDSGVTDLRHIRPALEAMQRTALPLLIHGEVTDAGIDIFDREAVFIDRVLQPLLADFPALRVVLEHITTADAAQFISESSADIGATITAHHLLFNRNHMLAGGIRPHYYCLPILKRDRHQQALIEAATSGNPRFFLGTDSAPHARHTKEANCGCAGCYTAHAALELYATAFERADALDRLEDFASRFGAAFYRLPLNRETITLCRRQWQVPDTLPLGDAELVPLLAGEALEWQVQQ